LNYYSEILKKLDIVDRNIDNNEWNLLSEVFKEINQLKERINTDEISDIKTKKQKEEILSKISILGKKINDWKEKQKNKIENLKIKENHINGYKKQSSRSYYIDKSE